MMACLLFFDLDITKKKWWRPQPSKQASQERKIQRTKIYGSEKIKSRGVNTQGSHFERARFEYLNASKPSQTEIDRSSNSWTWESDGAKTILGNSRLIDEFMLIMDTDEESVSSWRCTYCSSMIAWKEEEELSGISRGSTMCFCLRQSSSCLWLRCLRKFLLLMWVVSAIC